MLDESLSIEEIFTFLGDGPRHMLGIFDLADGFKAGIEVAPLAERSKDALEFKVKSGRHLAPLILAVIVTQLSCSVGNQSDGTSGGTTKIARGTAIGAPGTNALQGDLYINDGECPSIERIVEAIDNRRMSKMGIQSYVREMVLLTGDSTLGKETRVDNAKAQLAAIHLHREAIDIETFPSGGVEHVFPLLKRLYQRDCAQVVLTKESTPDDLNSPQISFRIQRVPTIARSNVPLRQNSRQAQSAFNADLARQRQQRNLQVPPLVLTSMNSRELWMLTLRQSEGELQITQYTPVDLNQCGITQSMILKKMTAITWGSRVEQKPIISADFAARLLDLNAITDEALRARVRLQVQPVLQSQSTGRATPSVAIPLTPDEYHQAAQILAQQAGRCPP